MGKIPSLSKKTLGITIPSKGYMLAYSNLPVQIVAAMMAILSPISERLKAAITHWCNNL